MGLASGGGHVMSARVFVWEDGERLHLRGVKMARGWRILADSRNTGSSRLGMGNQDIPAGGGIPVHLHDREEEILLFHEGRGELLIEGKAHPIEAGMSAFVPPGATHGVRNAGEGHLKLAWVFSPGGYENVFREMAARGLGHGQIEAPLGFRRPAAGGGL
ncbi:MAG: cupin domain-containing protein [Candidatus Tectomicrobia bacterium]|nr:cupin domain-containing protein [Candidatus Tectomicrobia bacterium]